MQDCNLTTHVFTHFTSRDCKEAELGGCLLCTAGAQQGKMLDSSAISKITVSTETTGSCQKRGATVANTNMYVTYIFVSQSAIRNMFALGMLAKACLLPRTQVS